MKNTKKQQLVFSFIMLVVSFVMLATATFSWLSRKGIEGEGYTVDAKGFSYKSDYVLFHELAKIETKYKDQDDNWVLIGTNLSKDTTEGEVYEEETIKLLLGQRTEFETKITNKTNYYLDCTPYLADTDVQPDIVSYITIGSYEPSTKIYDEDDFIPDDANNPTCYLASLLDLADTFVIGPKQSVTIKWYILIANNYDFSSYLALCDADNNLISEGTQEDIYHYCVVEYDGFSDRIYHAYKVNAEGEFVDTTGSVTYSESEYVEYGGSYTNLTYKYVQNNSLGYVIKLRGLYIAIGKRIEND